MRWELLRLFPLAGYEVPSHRTKACNSLREQSLLWSLRMDKLGWDINECMGDSVHSRICGGGDLDSAQERAEEEEYWVDTKMMLFLLLFWSTYRREEKAAHRCFERACTLLQMTCPAEDVPDRNILRCEHKDFAHCRFGCVSDQDPCLHIVEHHQGLDSAEPVCGQTPHAYFWQAATSSSQWASECPAIGRCVAKGLEALAAGVEGNFDSWAHQDFLKSMGLVLRSHNGKRRRMDPHAKQVAIADAIQKGRADKTSSLLRTLGLGCDTSSTIWMEQGLAFMHSASRLAFRTPKIASITLDCGTIGEPGRKMLLIAQYMWPADLCTLLPPQEPLSLERTP